MVRHLTDHPLPDELRAYCHGLLGPDATPAVEEHLTSCETCCRFLEQDSGDQFLGRLRSVRNRSKQGHDYNLIDSVAKDWAKHAERVAQNAETITFPGADHTAAGQSDLEVPPGWEEHPGYRMEGLIGQGGMGVVYKAMQLGLNRPVALKMVVRGHRAAPRELIRFLAEAEAVAAVHHPNVVEVYEYGQHDGRPFLALEYLPGGSLADRLANNGRLPPKAAAELVGTLAGAVQAAHDLGIVHRDLKPANVLYDGADKPKVTDFGLAKRSGGSDLTPTLTRLGTPAYMAPEQARGETKFVGPQADIYALGVVLYECLTGTRPFDAADPLVLLRKVVEEVPERPQWRVRGLPKDVELICLKCLTKHPGERYPSAAALADDLARFASGRPVSVRAAGLVERASKWARRKPTVAAAYGLTVAVIALFGFGSVLAVLWQSAERERAAAERDRGVAEGASAEAQTALRTAELTRDELRVAQDRLEAVEYGRTMQVAYQEWRDNNVAATLALLDSTRPHLRGWEWRYLYRLCHSEQRTLKIPTGTLTSAAFSGDGARIVTAGWDGAARVWDAQTGAQLFTLRGQPGRFHSAVFSPDGSRIATTDGEVVRVWDANTKTELVPLKDHAADVWSVAYSLDGTRIVTASGDRTAKVWDAKTGKKLLDLTGHKAPVTSAAFGTDTTRVVTVSSDKTAKVWNTMDGSIIFEIKGHTDEVQSAAFSPDGTRLACGCKDGTVRVCDASTGTEVSNFKAHATPVTSIAYSRRSDGLDRIVTACILDNSAKVWDASTGAELVTLRGHTSVLSSVMFSPDGSRVVTGSHDGTARVWDVAQQGEAVTLGEPGEPVKWVAFSGDGLRVLAGTEKKPGPRAGQERVPKLSVQDRLRTVAALFGQEHNRSVQGAWDGVAKAWHVKTGTQVQTVTGAGDATDVLAVWFGPSRSRTVIRESWAPKLLDVETGAVIVLTGHSGPVEAAAFSPDGTRVVTGSRDNTVRVWDANTGAQMDVLGGHSHMVRAVAFSPDGTRILAGCGDGTVKVWDVQQTKTAILTLKGHSAAITSIAMSVDGSRIVTSSQDRSAKLWDAKTGVDVLTLRGHGSAIHSAAFSPDGTRIATGGEDGTTKLWEAPRDVPPGPLPPPVPPLPEVVPSELIPFQGVWRCVLFAADGVPTLPGQSLLACVHGERAQFLLNGKEEGKAFDLRVDPNPNPKQMDLFLNQELIPAVYEICGNFLIAAHLWGERRPNRMPTGDEKEAVVDVIVFVKVADDAREQPTITKEMAGWNREHEALENLKVAQSLREVQRPGFADAVLRGLVDKFGKTKAGIKAAELLKTPK